MLFYRAKPKNTFIQTKCKGVCSSFLKFDIRKIEGIVKVLNKAPSIFQFQNKIILVKSYEIVKLKSIFEDDVGRISRNVKSILYCM